MEHQHDRPNDAGRSFSRRAHERRGADMTGQEALQLVRQMLKAASEEELEQIVSLNLSRLDGTFFNVLNQSVEQLRREQKPEIADALQRLGDRLVRMRTLI